MEGGGYKFLDVLVIKLLGTTLLVGSVLKAPGRMCTLTLTHEKQRIPSYMLVSYKHTDTHTLSLPLALSLSRARALSLNPETTRGGR